MKLQNFIPHHTIILLAILIMTRFCAAQELDIATLSAELQKLLPNDKAGAVIGIVNGNEEEIFVIGNEDFDEMTLFEYGSITKVFTAILLQQLADESVLTLEDNVYQYLPAELDAQQWQEVSLKHLATHTAGIPNIPPNLNPVILWILGRNDDPFARYDDAKLFEGVEAAKIEGTGEVWNYSNFGFGLLGHLLSNATKHSYNDLLQTRILEPLDMQTASTTNFSSSHIAPPLKPNGKAGNHFFLNTLESAGVVKGSMTDAIKFLNAAMQACAQKDALSAAICQTMQATDIKVTDTETQSLGWLRSAKSKRDIVWHNGGTRGHRSFLGFVPETNTGLVILMNVAEVEITQPALNFLNSF